MKTKNTKRRVFNWCFVICLVLLYVSQIIAKWMHIALGIIFIVLLVIHIKKYSRWLKASSNSFIKKKLKERARLKYLIACGLLIVFAFALITGFFSMFELITQEEVSGSLHRMHNIFAIVCGLLTVAHLATRRTTEKKASLPEYTT